MFVFLEKITYRSQKSYLYIDNKHYYVIKNKIIDNNIKSVKIFFI